MSSYILCSPQHAFLGVIGLFVCGLFTAGALESSSLGAESLAASHHESRELANRGGSVEGGATRTALASAEMPPHYYR